MTQQRLAAASGIRQSEISRIEGGHANPTLKTIAALARARALGGKHSPSVTTLRKYARSVGREVEIRLVPISPCSTPSPPHPLRDGG